MISPYILALVVGWILSQGAKYVVAAVKLRTVRVFNRLYMSGNMPSAHSATVVSILTMIGLRDGVDGGSFGLALAFAVIVMYDAVMVRRSVGEQGAVIRHLLNEAKKPLAPPHSAKGHTPLEVLVGALVGVCSGIVVFLATK